ncbi:superoxide dismutase [Sphingobacteriales bacterium UPWRP_1]|nr:superoxide dismutase [Sphingobacteriales bacterium TSM_CSS]PSJ74857.1 superoxide dismutase [Sphingobacteriales bacterium UPWRP_1]
MAFQLPDLPYAYNALEPHIDARTMEIHHSKHHAAYINNLNTAIANTNMEGKTIDELLLMAGSNTAVRNNGGGHWNHTLFWNIMSPAGGGEPSGALATAINAQFETFENFKKALSQAAITRFGSGWAWLGIKDNGSLCVCSTPNQDNPLMDIATDKCTPILGLDVWEHAYYLHYQNRRPDYVSAFFNVVNWNAVSANYAAAGGK